MINSETVINYLELFKKKKGKQMQNLHYIKQINFIGCGERSNKSEIVYFFKADGD